MVGPASKCLNFFSCGGAFDKPGEKIKEFVKDTKSFISKSVPALLSLAITVFALMYLYPLDMDDIQFDGQEYWAVSALGARNAIFISSIVISVSVISAFLVNMCSKKILGIKDDKVQIYKTGQELYDMNYLHTTLSVFIVAGWFLFWNLSGTGATDAEQDKAYPGSFLLIATGIAHGLKMWLDIKYCAYVDDVLETDGKVKFETGRQFGSIMAIMLSIYFLVAFAADIDFSNGDFSSEGSALLLVILLFSYSVVVSVEAKAENAADGWAKTGLAISQVLLYVIFVFVGGLLATHKTKEAVFVALIVLYLEGLQVGITQIGVEVKGGMITYVYRFIQFFLGILAIVAITPTTSESSAKIATADTANARGHLEALSTVLWGVGLASGVVKVFQASFLEGLKSPSPVQTFRKFSSTGLLIASSALWVGGAGFTAPSTLNTTFSTSLFVLALLNRLLDSFVDSSVDDFTDKQSGEAGFRTSDLKELFVAYFNWFLPEDGADSREKHPLDWPAFDNVRSWMVLASLGTSLGLLFQWSDVTKNLDGYAGVACGLIILHMAVVVVALLDGVVPESWKLKLVTKYLSLSRSSAIRFVVSTTVICSLIVVASDSGDLVSAGHLMTGDHEENWIIGSLVAYLFADAVGAEFL